MFSTIQSILTLSENRITYLMQYGSPGFYYGSGTFLEWIKDEIEEVREEMKDKNHVYLEDELGDIFWDYICLIENLEREGKIYKSRVFERCYKKFSERLNPDGSDIWHWNATKQK